MANELNTQGVKLSIKKASEDTYSELAGLTSTPDISSNKEHIEVTTLADTNKRYINGISDFGDGLEFGFNYEHKDGNTREILNALETANEKASYKITYKSGLEIEFEAEVSLTYKGAEVNGVESFTAALTPVSAFTFKMPTFH